jgi:hypothetical protein
MKRRSLWLIVSLAVAGCAAAVLLWAVFLAPSLKVSQLQSGDAVSLRSGLSFTVPPQASATFSRWRSPKAGELGLVDDVLFRVAGTGSTADVGALVYWTEGDQTSPLAMVQRGTQLASQSPDGSVQVRWSKPHPGDFNVFVLTRLPGNHPGLLQISAGGARDAVSAWHAANATWRLLNASGARLPAPPQ